MLENESDYIKNNYFKMLAVILQQGNEITEIQTIFYKRMLAGVKTEYAIEDYLRQALEIEINEFIDFTNQCSDMVLKYRFVIDAILLICCDKKDDKQIELVVSFMEFLKLKKEEIEYLSKLCKSILEQNFDIYLDVIINNSGVVDLLYNYIDSYISKFVQLEIFDNSNFKNIKECTTFRNIMFKNITFKSGDLYDLIFKENSNIIFKECEFIESFWSIHFYNCKKIQFKNCKFKSFSQKVFTTEKVEKLYIIDCKFENCVAEYSSHTFGAYAGIIYSKNNQNCINYIINTDFLNCGTRNGYSSELKNYAISNGNTQVKNSKFKNCWNWYSGGSTRAYDKKSSTTLFLEETTNNNNILEDCADFS